MLGIIPKTIKKAPQWHSFILYAALGLLVATILAYAISFYLEGRSYNDLQTVVEKISKVSTKEERITANKVLTIEKEVNAFTELFKNHKKTSNFFVFLEENTHPQVQFTEIKVIPEAAHVLISGQALNFEVLGQQVSIFQEQELIKSINLTDVLINKEGKTGFSLEIYFDPKLFQ